MFYIPISFKLSTKTDAKKNTQIQKNEKEMNVYAHTRSRPMDL